MPSRVIKKKDLPSDQVEPVSLDDSAFYKRKQRIPRERVQIDLSDASPTPERYDYLKRGVVHREEAAFTPTPIAVPGDEDELAAPATGDGMAEEQSAETDEPEEEDVDPLNELRVELEAEWSAKLEEAAAEARQEGFESGYDVGYDDGMDDAEAKLGQQFDAEVEQLAADVAQLKSLWEEYIEASEPALLELAVEVGEALLDTPLPDSIRGASARAIAEAVEELASAGSLTVTLHPVDYQRLQEKGMIDQLNANHEQTLHWHPDPEHAEGDWSVESPTALIRHQKAETLDAVKELVGMTPPHVHDGPDAASDDSEVSD